jgi:hypothetical protein
LEADDPINVSTLSVLLIPDLPRPNKPLVIIDTAPPPSARFPASWYPESTDVTYTITAPTNAHYTATLVTTTRFIDPATGQLKTLTQSTLQARDASGRQRSETEMPRPDAHGKTIMTHEVTVSDPVSHCNFRWMEPWVARGKPTAIVTCMPLTLHYTNQNIWADAIVTEPEEIHELDTVFRSEPLGKKPSTTSRQSASSARKLKPILNQERFRSWSQRSGTPLS